MSLRGNDPERGHLVNPPHRCEFPDKVSLPVQLHSEDLNGRLPSKDDMADTHAHTHTLDKTFVLPVSL